VARRRRPSDGRRERVVSRIDDPVAGADSAERLVGPS
jgi:hypothetical protein